MRRLLSCLIAITAAPLIPANAGELSPETAAVVYAMAHSVSGYKLPEQAPQIHLITVAKLRAVACPGRDCAVRGLQAKNMIFIDMEMDMDDPFSRAILFHEMVHYLQWASGGDARDCADWLRREVEAYSLQAAVLHKVGLRLATPILPSCA